MLAPLAQRQSDLPGCPNRHLEASCPDTTHISTPSGWDRTQTRALPQGLAEEAAGFTPQTVGCIVMDFACK